MQKWLPFILAVALSAAAALACEPMAPCYTEAGVVNGASFKVESIAPNTIASIFGTNLAWEKRGVMSEDVIDSRLPVQLGGVTVHISSYQAPLFYVSPTQINFLVPANLLAGVHELRVVRQGQSGPAVYVRLAETAPALFLLDEKNIVANHGDADYTVVDNDNPARPGEIIILWATGLGVTVPELRSYDEIPQTAAPLERLSEFRVSLNGEWLDANRIEYAGVAPGYSGLYQINLRLPATIPGPNPEIRIELGTSISPEEFRLIAQP